MVYKIGQFHTRIVRSNISRNKSCQLKARLKKINKVITHHRNIIIPPFGQDN